MLSGKNVIVTGASRGLGIAIVRCLVENGANVWACCRNVTEAFEVEMNELARKNNVWVRIITFDLEDEESLSAGIKQILDSNLNIDLLVNNAGISQVGLLLQTKVTDVRKMFEVNFFSSLILIQKVLKRMIRAKSGGIINIASVAGLESQPGKIAYGSSKAAVIMMTKCLSKEVGAYGIRVNAIAPGPVKTDILKQYSTEMLSSLEKESSLGRLGEVEEIAKVVLFLASENSSYINGQVIVVDGGR